MQIIKCLVNFFIFLLPLVPFAQSTYFDQNSKDQHFIERMEIRLQHDSVLNFSAIRSYNRKSVVQKIESSNMVLSATDQYNLSSLLMNNIEWTSPTEKWNSRKPLLKTLYRTKANFYEVNNKDLFLAINPVIHFQLGKEQDYDKKIYRNSRGVLLRGRIANKIGIAGSIVDNQERDPLFYQQQVNQYRAVPGMGFYKIFKNDSSAYDYFDGRGYFTFNAAKYIDIQFGYDKNFIGNGYRSLFLSDWGNSYLFAKINTRIWKFNYQNLFMELIPQFSKGKDSLYTRKYAAMHHLSMNVTRWLNLGLFEGVVFGRKDHFDFQYLNPVIFYRHIEGSIGSPDNAVAGFDFKANVKKRAQVYGQILLDEFVLSRVKNDPDNWANKFGFQLGAKYMDAFGINNLDLQVETNRVRPFTYSHFDTISNYTHYNQPLAHPLGSNFQELIGIVRYQPFPKLNIDARVISYFKGLDSAGYNYGGNIFEDYRTRAKENGYVLGGGQKINSINALLNISYEFRQNLFFELGIQHRSAELEGVAGKTSQTIFNAGIRLNAFRREGDF